MTENTSAVAAPEGPGAQVPTMHPDIAAAWDTWSVVIGQTALHRLEQVQEEFPQMSAAVLSSADGMHVCSIGMDEDDAGRLSALNSSLFGVARAEAQVMEDSSDPALRTIVTITFGEAQTAVLGFVVEPFGQLLLAVSARGTQLGHVMVTARSAASEIAELLGRARTNL